LSVANEGIRMLDQTLFLVSKWN